MHTYTIWSAIILQSVPRICLEMGSATENDHILIQMDMNCY